MQWLLASLINTIIGFLEFAFKKNLKDEHHSSSSTHRSESNYTTYNNDSDHQDAKIREAYEFMELSPPCEMEQLKKRFKKLSLRYHPDRSGGSHDMMIKLNECLAIVEKDIHGSDCSSYSNEHDFDWFDESEEEKEEDFEQMQRDYEASIEEELKRQKEFQRRKQKEKDDAHRKQQEKGLYSEQGRRKANEEFCKQVKEQNMKQKKNGKKEDQSNNNSKSSKSKTIRSKPKNYIMDYNGDDVVVALRFQLPDIAIGIIQEKMQKYMQQQALNAEMTGQQNFSVNDVGMKFLQAPLDLDDNDLIHYAIYYESYEVVKCLCSIALEFQGLDALLHRRNTHGHTPWMFASIAQDVCIQTLVRYQLTLVYELRTKTHFFPAAKAGAYRFGAVLWNIDIDATLCVILSYYLGSNIFQVNYYATFAVIVLAQCFSMRHRDLNQPDREIGHVRFLLSFFVNWFLIRAAFALIFRFGMIKMMLIMTPFAVVFIGAKRASPTDLISLPVSLQFFVSWYLERFLVLVHEVATPQAIKQRGHLLRPFLLVVTTMVALGIRNMLPET